MTANTHHNFIERTLNRLRVVWRDATENRAEQEHLSLSPALSQEDEKTLRLWIDHCLAEKGGEVAARVRAATLGRSYLALSVEGQRRFLTLLATHYGTQETDVETQIKHWQESTEKTRADAAVALRKALEPPRMQLLKLFNELPEGIKFLVDMRAQLLNWQTEHPELKPLEADLKRLLSGWFDIGLLQLEQINWHSSAALLEKLIEYEAVHAIRSWDDLKNRLDSDRRCFAFFHPNMPNEPLIFVEVALVKGLSGNVQALLDENAPLMDIDEADTAIFYSISNAQTGLAGISFGNFLIKRVVKELQHEFPHLTQFSTLSPIPGFIRWLKQQDQESLQTLSGAKALSALPNLLDTPLQADALKHAQTQTILTRLTAHYLVHASRKGSQAADPVAHFHLSNGAQIARINWMADSSNNGLQQSAGLMVNYVYDLPNIEARSQAYISHGTRAVSSSVKALLNT